MTDATASALVLLGLVVACVGIYLLFGLGWTLVAAGSLIVVTGTAVYAEAQRT